jgi:hypothetical protein
MRSNLVSSFCCIFNLLVPEGAKRKRSVPKPLQGKYKVSFNTHPAKLVARRLHPNKTRRPNLSKERRSASKTSKRYFSIVKVTDYIAI